MTAPRGIPPKLDLLGWEGRARYRLVDEGATRVVHSVSGSVPVAHHGRGFVPIAHQGFRK